MCLINTVLYDKEMENAMKNVLNGSPMSFHDSCGMETVCGAAHGVKKKPRTFSCMPPWHPSFSSTSTLVLFQNAPAPPMQEPLILVLQRTHIKCIESQTRIGLSITQTCTVVILNSPVHSVNAFLPRQLLGFAQVLENRENPSNWKLFLKALKAWNFFTSCKPLNF